MSLRRNWALVVFAGALGLALGYRCLSVSRPGAEPSLLETISAKDRDRNLGRSADVRSLEARAWSQVLLLSHETRRINDGLQHLRESEISTATYLGHKDGDYLYITTQHGLGPCAPEKRVLLTKPRRDGAIRDSFHGYIVVSHPTLDLAIVSCGFGPQDPQPLFQLAARQPRPGETLALLGFADSNGPSSHIRVARGAAAKRVDSEPGLCVRARVRPGYSGGPILSADGDILGITCAGLGPTRDRIHTVLAVPSLPLIDWIDSLDIL